MLGVTLTAMAFLSRIGQELLKINPTEVQALADAMYECYVAGRIVFVIGNGGSGSNASHFCEDLGKGTLAPQDFDNDAKKRVRDPEPDRQHAVHPRLGQRRGLRPRLRRAAQEPGHRPATCSSPSAARGNSPNILAAVEWANRNGLTTFGCTGFTGGKLRTLAQHNLHVPLDDMGIVEIDPPDGVPLGRGRSVPADFAVKVVILAGGYGTRFGKATDFLPKPMIPVGPFPILWHILRGYAHYGHDDFILCTGYKSEIIKEFFANAEIYANDFTVDFSGDGPPKRTDPPRDRLQAARHHRLHRPGHDDRRPDSTASANTSTANANSCSPTATASIDLNINDLIRFHHSHGKIATLTGVFPPPRFGDLKLDENRVTDFAEKEGKQGALVNGGFYVFKRELFDYLDDDPTCVLEQKPLQRLATAGQLMAYKHTGFWQCMDTTRDLEILQKLWASGHGPVETLVGRLFRLNHVTIRNLSQSHDPHHRPHRLQRLVAGGMVTFARGEGCWLFAAADASRPTFRF